MSCKCGWQGEAKVPPSAIAGLVLAMVGGPTLITLVAGIAGLAGADPKLTGALAAAGGGAGSVIGFTWGYCLARSGRLDPKRGKRCVSGLVARISRNEHPPFLAGITYDPDWTFDLIPRGSSRQNPSPLICEGAGYVRCYKPVLECGSNPEDMGSGQPTIHCEIPSSKQSLGCEFGKAGALLGGALGLAILTNAAPTCAAFGVFAPFCLLFVLILSALITLLATEIGAQIGHAFGSLEDEGEGLHDVWGTAMCGSCLTIEGEWVTDRDHGWNEIHDVTSIDYLVKATDDQPFFDADACPDKCPGADFLLRVLPPTRVVAPGGTAIYDVQVMRLNPAAAGPVTLSVPAGLTKHVSTSFSPASPVAPDATVKLSLKTNAAAPVHEYVFVVRGTAASGSRSVAAKLLVMQPEG